MTRINANDPQLTQRINRTLAPFIESGAVPGVVAVVADCDTILSEIALGFADLDQQEPMTLDSVFWVASQTKPITAAALMMLVDEHRLSLDDSVASILPEFEDLWVIQDRDDERMTLIRPVRPITVRDILSHTSGLPFRSRIEIPTLDAAPLSIATRSYAATPLLFQPGTRYEYSNAGINTAGRIIEVLGGMAYEAFLQKRLFDPLGMRDTTFWPSVEQHKLVTVYRPNVDKNEYEKALISQLQYPLENTTRYPMPAGGLFSTARDMVAFCRMILNGGTEGGTTYLSPTAIQEMTRRQTPPSSDVNYGLGWGLTGGSYGHGGAYGTAMTVYPDRGRITVFLVQLAGYLHDGDQCRSAFEAVAADA